MPPILRRNFPFSS